MDGNNGAGSSSNTTGGNTPDWLQQYYEIGMIGEGTYGVVFLAKLKSNPSKSIAIKTFKKCMSNEGVSITTIREIMLLRETFHENVVKLVNVHINYMYMSLHLVFDYADHDLRDIINHHIKIKQPISQYTVKSLLWQLLNGLHYLHSNWIMHRDLKPGNILVMGDGEEHGVVKIADFGLARLYHAPLQELYKDGVVVSTWYRAPELLLGAKHYTSAVGFHYMWSVGCIFADLLTLKPLFQGRESKATLHNRRPFQLDQLVQIFKVLDLEAFPHWETNEQNIQGHKYDSAGLHTLVNLSTTDPAYDLLSKMLQYDPRTRITAAQALEHEYFLMEPLPGNNSLVSPQPGENVVNYPIHPVVATNIPPVEPLPAGHNALLPLQPGEDIVNYTRLVGFDSTKDLTPIPLAAGMYPGGTPVQLSIAHQQQQVIC